jgi:hypothetical protein
MQAERAFFPKKLEISLQKKYRGKKISDWKQQNPYQLY